MMTPLHEMLSYRRAQDAGQNESEHHADKRVSQPGRSIRTHFGFMSCITVSQGSGLTFQHLRYPSEGTAGCVGMLDLTPSH